MRTQPFRQPISKPKAVPPEFNPWYWNPSRFGVKFASEDFRKRLKAEMGDELDVTWNPINERWQVWERSGKVVHKICQGWRLLFIHNGPDGDYCPLDERLFARLYHASAQVHGSGKQYFERIIREMERDKERREKQHTQDTIDLAMPSFEHSKIQIGYGNRNNGSKFADYLA